MDYLERWPDIPAVLTGGTGYGEEISEAQCMYDYLTEYGVEARPPDPGGPGSNTAENFAFSWELLTEAGVDPAEGRVAVVTNDFHIARAELNRRPGGLRRRGRDPSAAALGSFGDQLHPAGGLCHGKDLSV